MTQQNVCRWCGYAWSRHGADYSAGDDVPDPICREPLPGYPLPLPDGLTGPDGEAPF